MGRSFNMNANRVGHSPNTGVSSNSTESTAHESTLKSSTKVSKVGYSSALYNTTSACLCMRACVHMYDTQ